MASKLLFACFLVIINTGIGHGVCLDGSPPGYAMAAGSGCGSNNWVIYLEETKLFYRGSRVFGAIMEDLLSEGMDVADNVLLTGTSAGGLATILHCNTLRSLVPNAGRVKCFSDSGFFLHA